MRNYFYPFLVSLVIFGIGITIYHYISKQKIGYVKNGTLIQKYQGMIDANNQFAVEVNIARNNSDTLRSRFESLKRKESSVKPAAKGEWGYQLGLAEREYLQYSEAVDKQLQQRQQQLTKEVLDKINSYIHTYGEEHGYRFILGTTNEGSILYGLEQDDLTDQILSDLNKIYASSKKDTKATK
jgi:outer membrane protein